MDTNKQDSFEPYVVSVVLGELVILCMQHWTVIYMRSTMYYITICPSQNCSQSTCMHEHQQTLTTHEKMRKNVSNRLETWVNRKTQAVRIRWMWVTTFQSVHQRAALKNGSDFQLQISARRKLRVLEQLCVFWLSSLLAMPDSSWQSLSSARSVKVDQGLVWQGSNNLQVLNGRSRKTLCPGNKLQAHSVSNIVYLLS